MNNPIKVLIVDDYAVVRHGLMALIDTAPGMVVVGEADDGLKAVQQAQHLRPDVIVMDLMMPGLDGIGAVAAIKQASPLSHILILTNFGEPHQVRDALRAGVHGYLLKDAVLTDVVKAIRDVHQGKLALHPSITHILIEALQEGGTDIKKTAVTIHPALTKREQDVLKLIAIGLTNQNVADALDIDKKTVRIHVSNILRKLNYDTS